MSDDIYKIDGLDFVEDEIKEYFIYLDQLRESGITNMYGAGVYLEQMYDLSRDDAKRILVKWMETFSKRHNA